MSYDNGIFGEAVRKFTGTIAREGKTKVKAAPSLADANNCRPYHVVVKRNKKWFWKRHSKYFPSPYTISDLLVDDGEKFEEKETTQSVSAVNYNDSMKVNVHGKLGVSLANEMAGFDVDANHNINASVDFGKVVENYLDVPEVAKALKEKKLNMKDYFITETMDNERQLLCLVVASFNNVKDSKITTKIKGGGSVSANLNAGPEVPVTAEVEADGSSEHNRCLKIPANTPLAYRLNEMLVREDGNIQLMQIPGSKGGFILKYAKLGDTMPDLKKIRQTVEGEVTINLDSLLEAGQEYSGQHIPDDVQSQIRSHMKPILDFLAAEVTDDLDYLERFFRRVDPYEIKSNLEPIFEVYSEALKRLRDYLNVLGDVCSGYMRAVDEYIRNDVMEAENALSFVEKEDASSRREMQEIPRLNESGLADMRKGLIEVINRPTLLDGLILLVEEASNALLVGRGGKLITTEKLQEQLGSTEIDDTIKSILQMAGFTLQENDVKYPGTQDYKALNYLEDLLDLLTPLSQNQRSILCELSDEEKKTVVKVVSGALSPTGLPFAFDVPQIALFNGSKRVESLVLDLGFRLETFGNKRALVYRGDIDDYNLNPFGLLAIMSNLWGYQ